MMIMPDQDLAGGHFQSGEEGGGAVSLVGMPITDQRPSVGQPQIALGAFERLDMRLLVDRDHHRIRQWRQIKGDDLGRLGGKVAAMRRHWRRCSGPAS